MTTAFHDLHQRCARSRVGLIACFMLTPILCCFTTASYALIGGAQQAIQTLPETTNTAQPALYPLRQPSETNEEHIKRVKAWLASPAGRRALESLSKHPFLTYTAPSVFTPAGIPMKWGGIGIAAAGFTGYPTLPHGSNTWGGGGTVVLPVGDSDKILGGAIAVSEFGVQSSHFLSGGSTGNLSFLLIRWLGHNTIVTGGVVNVAPWGNVLRQIGQTYYGAVTQKLGLLTQSKMYVLSGSFGIGTGSFAPLGKLTSTGQLQASLDNHVYPFANLSLNFTPNIAIVGDYYSETFAVGLAYNGLLKQFPLSFLLFAGNLRHTTIAPTSTFGLRVSTGFDIPQPPVHKAGSVG